MISIRYNAVNYCIYSVFLIFILTNIYLLENFKPPKLNQVEVKLSETITSDLEIENEIAKNWVEAL